MRYILYTILLLPFRMMKLIISCFFIVIKNIFFNQYDLNKIHHMDGHEFEYFTKRLLEKNGFKHVKVSQSQGDYGIDVFACKKQVTYAIQCKRYLKPVGIKAVQEAKSGCDYYQCDVPVVFTNYVFTPAAKELAKNIHVELWDEETLYMLLKKSKLVLKPLPFYYLLISLVVTCLLGYIYYHYQQSYQLWLCLISLFFLFSIIYKMIRHKKQDRLLMQEEYVIHDYQDQA